MSDTINVKRGLTTRITEALGTDAGAPVDLTDKIITMRLVTETATVTLSEGSGIGFVAEASGQWYWDVTPANLTTLGDPEKFDAYLTMQNADNSLFADDSFTVNVTW